MDQELEQRLAVVAEARAWIGTPYISAAEIKKVGCDCLTFIVGVFRTMGYVPQSYVVPPYAPDWHMHRSVELYADGMLEFCNETTDLFMLSCEKPKPADIAMWRFGRTYSHAAIVIEWPRVIHAYIGSPVHESHDVFVDARLAFVNDVGALDYGLRRSIRTMRPKVWRR